MKSHNEEMRISDELPGPYDVEERRTVNDTDFKKLHPEWDAEKHKGKKRLAVLARMLEMKEAKLRKLCKGWKCTASEAVRRAIAEAKCSNT